MFLQDQDIPKSPTETATPPPTEGESETQQSASRDNRVGSMTQEKRESPRSHLYLSSKPPLVPDSSLSRNNCKAPKTPTSSDPSSQESGGKKPSQPLRGDKENVTPTIKIPLSRTKSSPPVIDFSPRDIPNFPGSSESSNINMIHLTPTIRNTSHNDIHDFDLDYEDCIEEEYLLPSTPPNNMIIPDFSLPRTCPPVSSTESSDVTHITSLSGNLAPIPLRYTGSFQRPAPLNTHVNRPAFRPIQNRPTATTPEGSTLHKKGSSEYIIQYQPSRDESLVDVGLVQNVLEGIFISRPPCTTPPASTSAAGDNTSTNLEDPIPLEERQWSIPSLRMAQPLWGSMNSINSGFLTEDEGEDILFYGSEEEDDLSNVAIASTTSSKTDNLVPLSDVVIMSSQSILLDRAQPQQSPQKKNPYEWLSEVERLGDGVKEAASSKFLTGGGRGANLNRMVGDCAGKRPRNGELLGRGVSMGVYPNVETNDTQVTL